MANQKMSAKQFEEILHGAARRQVEDIKAQISVFQEVSREKYESHSFASGYLGSLLADVMSKYLEKATRDFLLDCMSKHVEEMRSELRKKDKA